MTDTKAPRRAPPPLIIVNYQAARARAAWTQIYERLRAYDIAYEFYETEAAGAATKKVRAALRAGCETVAVVGGDGTLSEAAQGFFSLDEILPQSKAMHTAATVAAALEILPVPVNPSAVLCPLPAGTGDDFVRGLANGRRAPLDVWLMKFIACAGGKVRGAKYEVTLTDAICGAATLITNDDNPASSSIERFIALNMASLGLSAEVTARVGRQGKLMQKMSGEARFVAAALGALARWKTRRVRLFFDEDMTQATEIETNLIAVANNIYAGGGMMFAPGAETNDGWLDILTTDKVTRAIIMRELPRIRTGEHLKNPRVNLRRAKCVVIENADVGKTTNQHQTKVMQPLPVEADGNSRGTTPAAFRILSAAIRVLH